MKNIAILLSVLVLMISTSCRKEKMLRVSKDGETINSETGLIYTGCYPKEFTYTSSLAYGNVYDYYLLISLDNSQKNPGSYPEPSDFQVPHVGPGGVTIYNNVANDATYEVTSVNIVNKNLTLHIRCENNSKIKFNISIGGTWFLAGNSQYSQIPYITHDDGVNNIYSVIPNNGTLTPGGI